MKNFFLLLVVIAAAVWWFRRDVPSADSSAVHSRTTGNAVTAPGRTAANPQAVPPQQDQESERQRRKALADEYTRLRTQREAKEAAYKDAMAAYEAKRNAISEQLDALGRGNKNGVNNAAIDQLTEQRLRIPVPQPP